MIKKQNVGLSVQTIKMNSALQKVRVLFYASLVAATLHFTDNVIRLKIYPDLPTTTARSIILFGLTMVIFGVIGYYLCFHRRQEAGIYLLYVYCLMNMVVLGHYTPARMLMPFFDLPLDIHAFIWLEAITALTLFWQVVVVHKLGLSKKPS